MIEKNNLEKAITSGNIIPWYQPIVNTQGRMIGVEVLARWIQQDGTYISPEKFIPIALDTGLITPLTWSLVERAASELSCYRAWLPSTLGVAFNMPAVCLSDCNFMGICKGFLSVFTSPVNLIIEVSERDTASALVETVDVLKELIESGVEVALDDFGTGCANLNLLCQLPMTTIKLDRMFCTGLPGTKEYFTAAVMIKLARFLGVQVLAEGVETATQIKHLSALGANAFQGFYFSHPVPIRKLMWRAIPGALELPTLMGIN